MSTAATHQGLPTDPYKIGHGGGTSQAVGHGEGGPAPTKVVVGFGFWIFLLSDIIMFAAFFAAYAVLSPSTAGGPGPHELFDLTNVKIETTFLLLSSFACGLATIAAAKGRLLNAQFWLVITGLLGASFLFLELREFATMIGKGAGPQRSAFLSAFFTLVGCHGLHVTAGLLWLGTMMAQLWAKGFQPQVMRRLLCFSLFWHALDIIWVAVFTVVYILGVSQ